MNTKEVWETVKADGFMGIMEELHYRWLDEREYEDFNDYIEVVKVKLPKQFTFIKMAKKPFSVFFALDNCEYQISCTVRENKIVRIK